jgi:hypothetical protein
VNFQYPNIDISNLKDVMSGVANFFTGSECPSENLLNWENRL